MRDFLTEQLKPLLPEGWRWVPFQRNVDALDVMTVLWKQTRMAPLPEAPVSWVRVEGVLTVVSPNQDIERSEAALDDAVLDLVLALDSLPRIGWTEANKVLVADQYFGWDVSIYITNSKE